VGDLVVEERAQAVVRVSGRVGKRRTVDRLPRGKAGDPVRRAVGERRSLGDQGHADRRRHVVDPTSVHSAERSSSPRLRTSAAALELGRGDHHEALGGGPDADQRTEEDDQADSADPARIATSIALPERWRRTQSTRSSPTVTATPRTKAPSHAGHPRHRPHHSTSLRSPAGAC
jgi:hypothetical protein